MTRYALILLVFFTISCSTVSFNSMNYIYFLEEDCMSKNYFLSNEYDGIVFNGPINYYSKLSESKIVRKKNYYCLDGQAPSNEMALLKSNDIDEIKRQNNTMLRYTSRENMKRFVQEAKQNNYFVKN
ncbi:MAG: hypothetical protein AAGB32_00900 [Pseudomonadota bacterium]